MAEQTNRWIQRRVAAGKAGERLAVVFDVDETLLRNAEQIMAHDFGYDEKEWERWVMSAKAKPLEAVCRLFRTVRRVGGEVVVITGRPEHQREATVENLRGVGCDGYALLICKPEDETTVTTTAFKAAERKRLMADGWVIIANVGDQRSDLDGGFAEREFKLPNPFYFTP
jgi:predicted secreted acid phosphatase